MTCRVCGSDRIRPFITALDRAAIGRCARCGFTMLLREGGSSASYDEIYSTDAHSHPLTQERYASVVETLAPFRRSGRLLEVGFGGGEFLRAASAKGWDVVGTEVSSRAVENMRKEGYKVHLGEEAIESLAGQGFDAVIALEVLEHVVDPVSLLRSIHAVLGPGGVLVLSTPNANSLTRRLIGARWRVFASEHRSYFAPDTLARTLQATGFYVKRMESRNIYPPDILAGLRSRIDPSGDHPAGWAASSGLREFALRNRVGRLLRSSVNALLRSTGTGDTLWAWAHR